MAGASDEERAALLAGAAKNAAAALELDPDAAPDRDINTTVHGLYWLLVNLSDSSPLMVAVDDVQWGDEPSLRWLAYLGRRIEGLPIAVVIAARTGDHGRIADAGDSEAKLALLHGLLETERVARLDPSPLSQSAAADFIARAMDAEVDPAFAAACQEMTGGNPFLLSEVAAELNANEAAPTALGVEALERLVPDRVGETVDRHLARVSPPARRIAAAVAILGDGTELAIAAELASMDAAESGSAAGELVAAQILEDSRRLGFRHPLLRAAVEAGIPEMERGALHGEAARLLTQHGAPSGRVSAHLLLSLGGNDPAAVEQLRSAANTALSQGVPEQAAELLRRALAEPPPAELRPSILAELGGAALGALQADAEEHIKEAMELTSDLALRTQLAGMLGMAYAYANRPREAVDVLLDAIEEIRGEPELREQWLVLEAMVARAGVESLKTAGRVRGRLDELAASLAGETGGERLVRAIAAIDGPQRTAKDLFLAAREAEAAMDPSIWPNPAAQVPNVLAYVASEHPDAARDLADRMIDEGSAGAAPFRYALGLYCRGLLAVELGELPSGEADLRAALELTSHLDSAAQAPAIGYLVQSLVGQGRLDDAGELLSETGMGEEVAETLRGVPVLLGRGAWHAAAARWRQAESEFRELGRRLEAWGIERPTPPWRSSLAIALAHLGEEGEACELAERELALARTWEGPRALAAALRGRAVVGEGEEAIAGLGEAVAILDGTPWRLDRARARCDLGAAMRRAGQRRDGREQLTLAMDEAGRCGAEQLVERTADELRASGARPRRRPVSGIEALTPSELRVAGHAAAGKSNREIAQELFVTMATVETHLTRVYRKLDLDGRDGLAAVLEPA